MVLTGSPNTNPEDFRKVRLAIFGKDDEGRLFTETANSRLQSPTSILKVSDKLELNIDMHRKPSRTISKAGWVEA
jgi:hypothetical protein